MPWKNNRGVTSQIYIYPPSATLEKNDFSLRLSSAPIETNSEFSLFPDRQRILTVVKGNGIKLNENVYEKHDVAQFSGNDKLYCSLLNGPIIDLGLIYDPQLALVSARVLQIKNELSFSLDLSCEHVFSVLSGELRIQDKTLTELDTVRYKDEEKCQLKADASSVLLYLKISTKS